MNNLSFNNVKRGSIKRKGINPYKNSFIYTRELNTLYKIIIINHYKKAHFICNFSSFLFNTKSLLLKN